MSDLPRDADLSQRASGAGLLVVLPTYDERITLPVVVEQVRSTLPAADVLIVDDASPDGTGELAGRLATNDAQVHVLHRPGKLGLGSAYRDGFRWGMARGYVLLAEMDADLSHPVASLPALVAGLAHAEVAVGSRYVLGGDVSAWSARRRWLSRGANRYVRALTGLPVHDATSGFRVYRREVLERIEVGALRSEGYAFQVEALVRAHRCGLRIVEHPIRFVEREEGRSKLSRRVVWEAMWRVPVWASRRRCDRHR